MDKPKLLLFHGKNSPRRGNKEEFLGRKQAIGRSSDSQILFPGNGMVSKKHARFEYLRDGWHLEDRGSTNGTYLNGNRISGQTLVPSGSQIRLGLEGGPEFQVLYPSTNDATPIAATIQQSPAPASSGSGAFGAGSPPAPPANSGVKPLPTLPPSTDS